MKNLNPFVEIGCAKIRIWNSKEQNQRKFHKSKGIGSLNPIKSIFRQRESSYQYSYWMDDGCFFFVERESILSDR